MSECYKVHTDTGLTQDYDVRNDSVCQRMHRTILK